MSRIGNRELIIPEGVTVVNENNVVTVTGPKGELTFNLSRGIEVVINEKVVNVNRENEIKHTKQLHGTTNAIIKNMMEGVLNGFEKSLEAVGVGYRFNVQNNVININAGFSHPVSIDVPTDLSVEQKSNTEICISGVSKEKVGEFAANIRKVRKPEPYKGKGIRYKGEVVRRKEGKKSA